MIVSVAVEHVFKTSSSSSSSLRWLFRRFLFVSTTTTLLVNGLLDPLLISRASQLRSKIISTNNKDIMIEIPTYDDLYYPSSYQIFYRDTTETKRRRKRKPSFWSNIVNDNNNESYDIDSEEYYYMRGFCNWILPNRLMVGQYPGETPEIYGPSKKEVYDHLESMVKDCSVTCFICLQDEVPCQSNYDEWNESNGEVYIKDNYWRNQFPNPFKHYAPIVDDIVCTDDSSNQQIVIQYWHTPIEDLSIPKDSTQLQNLLLRMIDYLLEDSTNCIYLHCWGGRGRTGLVSGCLLTLLYPELDSTIILDWIQLGYNSRLGSDQMPAGLQKSPQTESQKSFVRSFVNERQRQQLHKQQK